MIQGVVLWVRAHNLWRAEPLIQRAMVGRFEFTLGIGYPSQHTAVSFTLLWVILLPPPFGLLCGLWEACCWL